MVLIARISKGTKMDQVYLPKNREGLSTGEYVIISPALKEENPSKNPFFYGLKSIEPVKLSIIFSLFSEFLEYDNVIITGSFLEKGFNFNDVDVLILSENKINSSLIKERAEKKTGLNLHIISLSQKTLLEGLSSDPLYENMLSKCVSLKRIILNYKRTINPALLDLHLLRSKSLMDNFEILSGREKYYLINNMIAIYLFIKGKKISNELINKQISEVLSLDSSKIKDNLINKKDFLKRYKEFYDETFNLIMEHQNEQK